MSPVDADPHPPDEPPRARSAVRRFGDRLAQACLCVAGAALAVIVVVNGANVTGRYVFGRPIAWAEELMLHLMVLIVFAGAASVTWRNAHIRIDIAVEKLPERLRRSALVLGGVIAIAVLGTVGVVGLDVVTTLYAFDQRSDALEMPIWIPQSVVSGGMLLMAFMVALRLVCAWQAWSLGAPREPEEAEVAAGEGKLNDGAVSA
ncbi:TRAP transporter small permease [Rhodoplanes roseus]|uniref:TRAP transporter small permease n=1 Tax=Rhodoplanes roseus TaxID=29409 RepID=UPI001475F13B|nr:TRAP transporter small permease [Rhodoplanes roseus]